VKDELTSYSFDEWTRRGRINMGPSLGNLRPTFHERIATIDTAGHPHLTPFGRELLLDALDYTWAEAAARRKDRETEADKAERARQRKARLELEAERAAAKGLRGMRAPK
jgi:hypothetical protein